jgi:hypothetical protein
LTNVLDCQLGPAKQKASMLLKDSSGFCQCDAARSASKQLDSDFVLQSQQLLAERWLSDSKGFRGPADGADIGYL